MTETTTGEFREDPSIPCEENEQKDAESLEPPARFSILAQILAAIFYGSSSFAIVIVIKSVLTTYKFPSFQFLGLGQIVATLVILRTCKTGGVITFPDFQWTVFRRIWPLPAIYLGNLMFGLSSTQSISLPMFTCLRRGAILLTLLGEEILLKLHSSNGVRLCVVMMIGGAILAAFDDLAFDLTAYVVVTLNNICSAGNGVYIKQKLDAADLGKYGIMYYNALFVLLPALLIAWFTGDVSMALGYPNWNDGFFAVQFLLSSVMGCVLIYSTVLCTAINSPLTTTIVGSLKNVFVTYIGLVFGGDYLFSFVNFMGLNVSVVGGILYAVVKYRERQKQESHG